MKPKMNCIDIDILIRIYVFPAKTFRVLEQLNG